MFLGFSVIFMAEQLALVLLTFAPLLYLGDISKITAVATSVDAKCQCSCA